MSYVVTKYLQQTKFGYRHFCPVCNLMHFLPSDYKFNNDHENPTFFPSFKQHLMQIYDQVEKKHIKTPGVIVCHYTIKNGQIHFLNDCTHHVRSHTMPMVELSGHYIESLFPE